MHALALLLHGYLTGEAMKKTNKKPKKLTYKYVVGVRWKNKQEYLFGVSTLEALMQVVLFQIVGDKQIKNWTACEYKEAKKSGMAKYVHEVVTGLKKPKQKRKAKKK